MTQARVHIAPSVQEQYRGTRPRSDGEVPEREPSPRNDPFAAHPPPFDLTSDMLLAGATAALAPLAREFPDLAVRTIGGRALLGIWFSRITEVRAGPGVEQRLGPQEAPADLPYQELNVAIVLQGQRLFVPGIYATSDLTLRLGHRYGMPKEAADMTYDRHRDRVSSRAIVHGIESRVDARPIPSGRFLGALAARTLPWWTWPVEFPSGSSIEGYIEHAGGAQVMRVRDGRLALAEPWLPEPVRLWPLSLRIPQQIMRLPAP